MLKLFFFEVAYVPVARHDFVVRAEKFLYGLCLGGRLHDDKIAWGAHNGLFGVSSGKISKNLLIRSKFV